MQQLYLATSNIFDLRLKWLIPLSASVFIAVLILGSQNLLLQLPGPAIIITAFFMFFIATCKVASYLTDRFSTSMQITYPTVILWCYPMTVVGMVTIGSWLFLGLSNHLLGRSFWSSWLGLTSQDTTSFFFACFASMLLVVSLQFASSIIYVFNWIIEISRGNVQQINSELMKSENDSKISIGRTLERLRYDGEQTKSNRMRATKINRLALFCIFILGLVFASWIIFFRPALILYYRAEIQLRTFLEPAAAYETLRHLSEKFPRYRYMDSVIYRMAWIQDRRLNEYENAKSSYENFLKRFGRNNIWSDEAIASLVRLSSDKLKQPDQALYWASQYLNSNPNGIMAPHMHLYRIRAFKRNNQPEQAQKEIEIAQKVYNDQKIQIINSEDRLIDLINFTDALKAEINADQK